MLLRFGNDYRNPYVKFVLQVLYQLLILAVSNDHFETLYDDKEIHR